MMEFADVNVPIKPVYFPWEIVMKAERAAEKVQERMHKTAAALTEAGIPFAVIGGNAVAVWVATKDEGAVRNTKDVDLLINRSDLGNAATAMKAAGFDLAEVNGVTMFLDETDPIPSRGVHLLFAGERVRSHDSVAAPAVKVGIVRNGVPALDLRELLILKLIAYRDIDRVHLRDMIKVGLIDDAVANRIPDELRPRLDEIIANPDG